MTTFIYDYDAELKRKWAKESETKEGLLANIQSLIASRLEQDPEDSGDDPVSRLSRRIRQTELEYKLRQMEIWGPGAGEKRRQDITYENNVKKSLRLQGELIAALSGNRYDDYESNIGLS